MHQDWKNCKTTEELASGLRNNMIRLDSGLAEDIDDVVQRAFELGLESRRSNKPKYVKFVCDDFAYYFSDPDHLKTALMHEFSTRQQFMRLMQHSTFVVDKRQNELKKCRFTIEDVIDAACM